MDTWEIVFLSMFGLLVFLVGIGAIRSFYTDSFSSVTTGFKILYYFLPYSLFLFAGMSDLIVQEFHLFPAALTSSVLVVLNYLIAKLVPGGLTQDTDICGIPGLSKVGSNLVPQSILFVSSFMGYIVAYVMQRNASLGYPVLGVAAAIALTQISVLTKTCAGQNYFLLDIFPSSILGTVGGAGIGALMGYFISKYVNVGSGADTSQNSVLGSKSPITGPPASKTPGVGTCSAANDQDQFVCEAYKNGQLVTSTIVE